MTRQTPLWLQAGSYPAAYDRRLIGSIWPTAAVTGCAVSVGGGMNMGVAPGTVVAPTANGTGSVLCYSDAAETVTAAAAPASGSNRIDLVVCQPRGNDLDGGANNDFIFTVVTGTAAATPVAPAVPAGAVVLAQVYIPGGSSSVTAGNITDRRVMTNPTNLYSARAYRQAAFVPTAVAPIVLDTASFDPSSGFNLGTGLYTCPAAGVYMVTGALSVSSTAAAQILVGTIQRNGTSTTSGGLANSTAAAQTLTSAMTDLISCAKGDTLALANGYNPFALNGVIGSALTYLAVQYLHA
jgi:hypothetical protein